jgi:diguanylate cyclase
LAYEFQFKADVMIGILHSPWLVLLSVVIAILGGYVGLGLAAQASNAFGLYRRGLLAGAAWSLGLSIWTMHFVGMLAAQLPDGTLFSVLLTLLSFLLCVIVVGIAAFIVSNYSASKPAAMLAASIMGMGIVLMHYLGMHAISGGFMMHHDMRFSIMAAFIAVGASYHALRIFENEHSKKALALSAVSFGLAVSGMHYTAMLGLEMMPASDTMKVVGPVVSSDTLMIVVAVLAFVVSAVFLLYLVPERNVHLPASEVVLPEPIKPAHSEKKHASAVPVESDGMTTLFAVADIHAIQAATHYCSLFDGTRELFSPWSITDMERRLDPEQFMRVHRSHIVAVSKVRGLRKAGDSAVVEVGQQKLRSVPVSRASYAELKSRLGLIGKGRLHGQIRQVS